MKLSESIATSVRSTQDRIAAMRGDTSLPNTEGKIAVREQVVAALGGISQAIGNLEGFQGFGFVNGEVVRHNRLALLADKPEVMLIAEQSDIDEHLDFIQTALNCVFVVSDGYLTATYMGVTLCFGKYEMKKAKTLKLQSVIRVMNERAVA